MASGAPAANQKPCFGFRKSDGQPRFLVQFRQDKVCVKFVRGSQKNGNVPTCKRKNNRLLEVAVP